MTLRFDAALVLGFFFGATALSGAAPFFAFNGDDPATGALRFFDSVFGFTTDADSFCFLLVGGLCTFVASTLLVLRFLLEVVDSPVRGCRFSFAAACAGDKRSATESAPCPSD